jgi:HlyD family secretion protein
MMMTKTFVLLLLTMGLVACKQAAEPQELLGTLEWDRVELVANESEMIVRLEVVEGQRIEEQQLLMVLDQRVAQARLDGAIASQGESQALLDEVLRGPREERIAEARAVLEGSEARLADSTGQVQRQIELVAQKLSSEAILDRLIAIRDSNQAELDSAVQNLKAANEGNTEEEIRQAQFGLQLAEAEVAMQQLLLQRLEVMAPVAGVIDSIPLKLGSQPRTGEAVAVLLTGSPFARVYLPEPLKARVNVGDQFAVRIDGVNDLLQARVRYLSREAAFTPYFSLEQRDRSRLVFEMELEFDDPDVSKLAAGIPLQVLVPDLLP